MSKRMMSIVTPIVTLLSLAGSLHADFKPEFAADQAQITTLSLLFEEAQFQALNNFRLALEAERVSKVKARKSGRIVERYKVLVKSKQVTEVMYAKAQLDHLTDLMEQAQHKAEAEEALARTKVGMLEMKEQGNPNSNHVQDVIAARIELQKANIAGFQAALDIARETLRFSEEYLANGKRLQKGSVVSEVEIDDRLLRVATTAARVNSLITRIETANQLLQSLQSSLNRIQAASPPQ